MKSALQIFTASVRALAYTSLALVISGITLLVTAGFWLAPPNEPPQQADVIIVLFGGMERSTHAAELYLRGIAPTIWVSRPAREQSIDVLEQLGIVLPNEEEIHRRILNRKGVPPHAIRFFGEGSVSSVDEAHALKRLATPAKRMLVVTSPTHVLRARLMLSSVMAGAGSVVQVVATPYEAFERRWWQNQESARSVILEIAKLTYDFLGGRFFSTSAK